MKPKIHLNGSIGLLMLGVGFIPMVLIGLIIYEKYFPYDLSLYRPSLSWEMIVSFVLGTGFVLSGLGLIFKVKWAQFLAAISILFGAMWMAYVIYDEFRFRNIDTDDFWVELGVMIFVYTMLFFGLLFIGNDKVRKDFGEVEETYWDDNILDT